MHTLLKARQIVLLLRHLGFAWLFFRLQYALRQRSGWFARRWPVTTWDQRPFATFLINDDLADPFIYKQYRASQAPQFFFDPAQRLAYQALLGQWDDHGEETPQYLVKQLRQGQGHFFEHHWWQTGFPPNWHRNALTGEATPPDTHWSKLGDFGHGDIKVIWEPGRFGWAYALVRAYWRTGDESYAETFWQLLEHWCNHNQPYQGVHWRCGQETTFRVMAWCFALYGFAFASSSTPARIQQLAQMIALSAERIASNLSYALSQRNNHGVSEGVGLWTIGLLFPEFREAATWRERGRQVLEELAEQLIADDGAFSQHSMNYHRVMLHDYLWAVRLGECNHQRFSPTLHERVRTSARFLHAFLQPATGSVPRYGANDGALVLPLTNCDHRDFRPLIQSALYLLEGVRTLAPGAWDEELLWLSGPAALEAPKECAKPPSLQADASGYYLIRDAASSIFIRCGSFRQRPGHADLLHLDLWYQGQNIALDPGTYSYNAPPPWDDPLSRTLHHNSVTVDGLDQMDRVSRFLWLPWISGNVRQQRSSRQSELTYWEGEHSGYQRLASPVSHRRAIVGLGSGTWLVLDDLTGAARHTYRLHWLFDDLPYLSDLNAGRLELSTSNGSYIVQWGAFGAEVASSLVRAGIDDARGWQAPYYLERTPAVSLAAVTDGSRVRYWTLFSALPLTIRTNSHGLHLSGPSLEADCILSEDRTRTIVDRIVLRRPVQDTLLPMSIKVLLLHQAFATPAQAGGTRHYEFAQHLLAQQHACTVVTSNLSYRTGAQLSAYSGLVTEEEVEGLRILRAYTLPVLHRSFVWRVVAFFSFMFTSVIASLRADKVDLVIGTTPPIFQSVSAWLVAVMRRRPFLLEVRDLWPEFAIDIGVLKNPVLIKLSRLLERFLYRVADHILVNSPAYRDYLIARGISSDKVTLIANGVAPDMFDPDRRGEAFRAQWGLDGKFVAMYTGALGLANDIPTIVAAAELLQRHQSIQIVLVGDGKERTALEAQVLQRGLTNVLFVGAQPKAAMKDVIAAADVCIATLQNIPMFTTTYPNKVFDYMAAGRPTILAIDGVIRQVIDAAQGGVFVPPGDPASLAVAVLALSTNPETGAIMGHNARRYVTQHFNRADQAKEFERLLISLSNRQNID
ncbi:heparinase II/III family protein [Candidatus Chloroploca sp. M-50]|uniref:Heparinase II/III family protein n=1 Tax=Candidatus Chloroploca mongolica TaxID=2528176 RepID=A0ABS4D8I6_9CHLR|nr:heparinase II/III family protein [Candidatus Chloroploca mongolica]MBP1465742.1 heparinase II/III family protein [Candidatus Chloroploca mongolica]